MVRMTSRVALVALALVSTAALGRSGEGLRRLFADPAQACLGALRARPTAPSQAQKIQSIVIAHFVYN